MFVTVLPNHCKLLRETGDGSMNNVNVGPQVSAQAPHTGVWEQAPPIKVSYEFSTAQTPGRI